MAAYVVVIDVAYLGIDIEAESEEEAKHTALNTLDSVCIYVLKRSRVIKEADCPEVVGYRPEPRKWGTSSQSEHT